MEQVHRPVDSAYEWNVFSIFPQLRVLVRHCCRRLLDHCKTLYFPSAPAGEDGGREYDEWHSGGELTWHCSEAEVEVKRCGEISKEEGG